MFTEWARYYGKAGAHLIVVPRATSTPKRVDKFHVAMQMAAIVSGCYVASSNRVGEAVIGGFIFGGRGRIYAPGGELLATTSTEEPVVWVDIDLHRVERAKSDYPVYIEELPK